MLPRTIRLALCRPTNAALCKVKEDMDILMQFIWTTPPHISG